MGFWSRQRRKSRPVRHEDAGGVQRTKSSAKRSPPVPLEVKLLVMEALETDLSLKDIAELVGVTQFYRRKADKLGGRYTDFTYFKVISWGWYYLLTVLDDYSRYIIDWQLFTGMGTGDVQELLDRAIATTGVERVAIRHRPRLLSDNGPCFISKQLQEYLEEHGMGHTRCKPYHPMTQGKIERYHRSLKNVICLDNHYLPWQLEEEIRQFVSYYNHQRVHESLENLTPADVYHGLARDILTARERLKRQTLRRRRRYNMALPEREEELIRPALFREVSLGNKPELVPLT